MEDNFNNDDFYSMKKDDIIQDTDNNEPIEDFKTPNYNAFSDHNFNNHTFYKKPKEKKRYGVGVVILASVLAAVIGACSSLFAISNGYISIIKSDDNTEIITPSSNVNINVDKSVESVVEAVAEKVSSSVVGIRTTTSVMSFFGGSSESTGEGSGVIYSSDGYIVTNYHVIEAVAESTRDSKIEVFLNNDMEKPYEAQIIGYHISSDLAVIKINATGLPKVTIAESDSLKLGQYVIAIGNPGGLEFMGSVTYGVVSGLNRVVSGSGIELIQTDAAINPGNSGGALLNTKGELVGINSSKIVAEGYEGMGFAIPSKTVVEKCDRIINHKDYTEPYIGITISENYTSDILEDLGFPVGAVVLRVAEGSTAEEAGIRRGDIITEFNGKKITECTLFNEYLSETKPNTSVSIKLYRSGKYYSGTVKISSDILTK